jgi:nitrogen-specific signal transduction histidine kinase/CheY-like chemotaxis protein
MEVNGSALPPSSLGDGAIVCVSRDVTDRRRFHERLSRLQRVETLTRMAGGLAHDVNNALAAVVGNAELLELRFGDDAEAMEDLDEIKLHARRAASLIAELRAMATSPVVEPIRLHLDRWIDGIAPTLRRTLRDQESFIIDCEPELGVVEADPNQLEQVLVNLVNNAADAIDGGGEVRIALANQEVDPRRGLGSSDGVVSSFVVISVTDNGQGMNEATRSRAAEPFFTTKLDGPGAGLGLTTVESIVRQFGGFLTINSAEGQGTEVQLHLPRVEDDRAEAPVAGPEIDAGKRETVMVVDDDAAVLRVAVRLLRANGYTVLEAGDAAAALRLAAEFEAPIDLLLTDIVMPQTNGLDLALQFTRLRPEIRVVYMSGYSDEVLERHGGLPPDTMMVVKPFSAGKLISAVQETLRRS